MEALLERADIVTLHLPLTSETRHLMLKALREGDRERLIELCAPHLDISRQAYLQTHRLRFSA